VNRGCVSGALFRRSGCLLIIRGSLGPGTGAQQCGLPACSPSSNHGSRVPPSPLQPSSVKSLHSERLIRTSLDLELDLQATRTWHSQLTQEISVLKELKEQLEQARKQGEQELPARLREDERFRLLLRMLEWRVSVAGRAEPPSGPGVPSGALLPLSTGPQEASAYESHGKSPQSATHSL
jgi:hypothetical protein